MVIPPPKKAQSAIETAMKYHKEKPDWMNYMPASRYVTDFLRATFYAQDPYVLALAITMLEQRSVGLPRISNYFIGHEDRPAERHS